MDGPMNDGDFSELIDKAMAGRLTPGEEIRWRALLAERPELEEDLAVGRALQALPPPPPVSSNFTALVLRQIRHDERATARGAERGNAHRWFHWPGWARVVAMAAVAAVLAFAGLQFHQQQLRDEHDVTIAARTFVGEINKVAETHEAPAPEAVVAVFKDFNAIRNLSESSEAVDYDLLKALGSSK
jgi:hypothetical protein